MLSKAHRLAVLATLATLAVGLAACEDIVGLGSSPAVGADDASLAADATDSLDASHLGARDAETEAEAGPHRDAASDADGGGPTNGSGALDPTFGDAGIVTLAGNFIGPHGLAIQSNDDVVYCGALYSSSFNEYALLIGRLTPDGVPDTSFDFTGSRVVEQLGPGTVQVCAAMVLVPDGSIVAGGYTNFGPQQDQTIQMFTSRFAADGAEDTMWGDAGFASIDETVTLEEGTALALLPDDDSVVLGGIVGNGAGLAKFTNTGALIPTFGAPLDAGPGGVDVLAVPDGGWLNQLVPRAGGGLVAAIQATGFLALGITPGGALDSSYGDGGLASVAAADPLVMGAVDMVMLQDGSTVSVGSTVNSVELVRFTAAGQLDPGFGHSGHASASTTMGAMAMTSLLPTSRLPGGGFAVALADPSGLAGVARFTAAGILDTTFGHAGFVTFAVPPNATPDLAIAADTSGRIYLAAAPPVDTSSPTAGVMQIFRILP